MATTTEICSECIANAERVNELNAKLDTIGAQMNWLCENTQNLFTVINQMSAVGPAALLSMMKGDVSG